MERKPHRWHRAGLAATLLALWPGASGAFGDNAGVPQMPWLLVEPDYKGRTFEPPDRTGAVFVSPAADPAPAVPAGVPRACEPDPGPSRVRLLVVFDDTAVMHLGTPDLVRDQAEAMIDFTNRVLEHSGAMVVLEFTKDPVGMRYMPGYVPGVTGGPVSPEEGPNIAALCDLTCGVNGGQDVHAWREKTEADLVVFMHAPPKQPPECGMAWVLGERGEGSAISPAHDAPYAYGVVSMNPRYRKKDHSVADCPSAERVFAHEVGHMFGAGHERNSGPQDKIKGAFDSSRAFTNFVAKTTMATIGAQGRWRPLYSNDSVPCDPRQSAVMCGIGGSSENADTILATRHCVSSFWSAGTTAGALLDRLESDNRFGRLDRCHDRVGRCR